jgi:hypothetical protein
VSIDFLPPPLFPSLFFSVFPTPPPPRGVFSPCPPPPSPLYTAPRPKQDRRVKLPTPGHHTPPNREVTFTPCSPPFSSQQILQTLPAGGTLTSEDSRVDLKRGLKLEKQSPGRVGCSPSNLVSGSSPEPPPPPLLCLQRLQTVGLPCPQ